MNFSSVGRLSLNQRGQVIYKLKKPYSDGTIHIVMSQLELLERLAAIVPSPRVHLTRFTGVFAPHYKHRAMVVPKPKDELAEVKAAALPAKSRMSWARLLKRVFNIEVESCNLCGGKMKIIAAIAAAGRSCTASHAAAKPHRLSKKSLST